jgi:hypothetical protein
VVWRGVRVPVANREVANVANAAAGVAASGRRPAVEVPDSR